MLYKGGGKRRQGSEAFACHWQAGAPDQQSVCAASRPGSRCLIYLARQKEVTVPEPLTWKASGFKLASYCCRCSGVGTAAAPLACCACCCAFCCACCAWAAGVRAPGWGCCMEARHRSTACQGSKAISLVSKDSRAEKQFLCTKPEVYCLLRKWGKAVW